MWATIAVVQSPPLPLLLLVTALGCCGGLLVITARWPASPAPSRFVAGVLLTAVCVLVIVGIGHHVEVGLATVAVLTATSPSALRWIVGE